MNAGGRIVLDLLRWTRLDYSLSGIPTRPQECGKKLWIRLLLELDFNKAPLLDYTMEEINEYVLSDVDATMYLYITTIFHRYSISLRLYAFHWQHMSMLHLVI
jgi:hypothetical protein